MSTVLHPTTPAADSQPLAALDQWDDFLEGRYKEGRSKEDFRVYDAKALPGVAEFYRLNHENQTVAYVLDKEKQYFGLTKGMKTIWAAAEFLNTLVDDSDPDTDLTQIEHLLQTSEAIRADGHPRWFVVAGFVHDLGKVLCLWGEPQWGVVGDTFPVGCAFSEDIVFHQYFAGNPDLHHPVYSTKYGVYEPNCGLEKVHMSFGHDGYIYEVMKNYLPTEALYMLRYQWAHRKDRPRSVPGCANRLPQSEDGREGACPGQRDPADTSETRGDLCSPALHR